MQVSIHTLRHMSARMPVRTTLHIYICAQAGGLAPCESHTCLCTYILMSILMSIPRVYTHACEDVCTHVHAHVCPHDDSRVCMHARAHRPATLSIAYITKRPGGIDILLNSLVPNSFSIYSRKCHRNVWHHRYLSCSTPWCVHAHADT